MTAEEIQNQINQIIASLSEPSEYEIDNAITVKNKITDKIASLNALKLELAELNSTDYSPVGTSEKLEY